MVKVSKHEVKRVDLYKSKKYAQYKTLVPDLDDILPKGEKCKVYFTLSDTNSNFANAIRRAILNEIPVKSLDYDEYSDTKISDPFIFPDFLKKQIQLIPIKQSIDYDDIQFSLHVENNTDEIIEVKTSDFTIVGKKNKVKVSDIMSPLIPICYLRPMEYLHITNIRIVIKTGREFATFCYIGNIYYQLPETKESSLNSNPTEITIGYSTYRNIDNQYAPAILACEVLIERLEIIRNEMKKVENKDDFFHSDKIQVETKGAIKEVQIRGEHITLPSLIAKYIYNLTETNIKFVTHSIIHFEKEIGVIKITHKEFSTLIQDAAENIIKDLEIVKSALKKIKE